MRRSIAAFALSASFVLPFSAHAQTSISERLASGQPPLVFGFLDHYSGVGESGFPANSLAAIQHALDSGLEGIAITVQVTGDNHHVLTDQSSLNRNTNIAEVFPHGPPGYKGSEPLRDPYALVNYTLEEIRQLNLSDAQDGGTHGIPTLAEALELIGGRLFVVIEAEDSVRETLDPLLLQHDAEMLVFYATAKLERDYDFPQTTGARMMGKLFTLQYAGVETQIAALEEMVANFGPAMPLAEISSRQLSPELLKRASELGVRLVVHGGGSDVALKNGNPENWHSVLSGGPMVFFSDFPSTVIEMMGK